MVSAIAGLLGGSLGVRRGSNHRCNCSERRPVLLSKACWSPLG